MSRVKENQEAIKTINALYEQNADLVTNTDELVCFHLTALVGLLKDISKSLAVIADKVESEEV